MKLHEFLSQFDGLDPECQIHFQMSDGCCGDVFELDEPFLADGEDYVQIIFPALDFLSSCRRSAAAQLAVRKNETGQ